MKKIKQPIDYPLSENQKKSIEFLDKGFAENSQGSEGQLKVEHLMIPFPKNQIMYLVEKDLQDFIRPTNYIPRSIGFVQEGLDWHFFIGTRSDQPSTQIEQIMFMAILNATNNRR